MYKSKLFEVLKALTQREKERFKDYVCSPFFNKSQKVRQLFLHIDKFLPAFDHAELAKTHVYTQIIGEAVYNEYQLNNVISDLLQLAYDFMAQLESEQNPAQQKDLLASALLDKELSGHLKKTFKNYKLIQERSVIRNQDFYLNEYFFYEKQDRHFLSLFKREYDESLQQKNDFLDLYYHINKLRIACEMQSRNVVTKSGYQCYFIEEILQHYACNHNDYSEISVLKIYYETFKMLKGEKDENYFYKLKKSLPESYAIFPQEELRFLYNYLLNYSIKKINSGDGKFNEEALALYQLMLEQKIIFKNGYLTHWTFKNIVTLGIRVHAFDWTEQFISQYQNNLLTEDKNNAISYNLAALHYARKHYKEALWQLQDVAFTNHSYHLGAKIIQLKSYFELEETEAFFALIESSKKFIQRSRQLSDYGKTANLNFLKLSRLIYRLKTEWKLLSNQALRQRQKSIREKLAELDLIANKDWLAEVFENLICRKK